MTTEQMKSAYYAEIKFVKIQKQYWPQLYKQQIQPFHTTPTAKITKNTNTNTIKKDASITDRKLLSAPDTSSNICENSPPPIIPVTADNILNPSENNNTIISG